MKMKVGWDERGKSETVFYGAKDEISVDLNMWLLTKKPFFFIYISCALGLLVHVL